MPRPLRIEFAGACYHVINRGNYRRSLFDGKGSAEAFVRTLGEAAVRFQWRVHAYVVMRNHFHLAVEITEPNLSEGMKWLQGTWIRRYNGMRKLIGRPFQGRYKALLVEPGHAFAQVCHYIHLNPVRAGAVTASRLPEFQHGSLAVFPAKKRPAWLAGDTVLQAAGSLPDTAAGWRKYQRYLEFLSEDKPSKKALASRELSRGWCVGSADFRKEMRRAASERGAELDRFAGLEPEVAQDERHAAWEEKLQKLAALAGIALEPLPAAKSHPDKVLLASALKQSTSVSNGWLADRLEMGEPASASQFVRRLLLKPAGRTAVQRLLARYQDE
ncbi:MAG: transposase [Candidatus Didemnitutus sp.]|nr:transposase [Candidatus Didemnitutus sp.]